VQQLVARVFEECAKAKQSRLVLRSVKLQGQVTWFSLKLD
jgi:hypothetical protein